MDLVIVESPFKSKDVNGLPQWCSCVAAPYPHRPSRCNVLYARRAMLDSLERGEAPFLSHLLYTQVWDDNLVELRNRGIEAGLAWGKVATLTAVYEDLGISEGMRRGIIRAEKEDRLVVFRKLGTPAPELNLGT